MLHDSGLPCAGDFEREIVLSETDKIVLTARKSKGRIACLAIIGISAIGGREHQIVRFDMSHGFLHKDLLFEPKGGKEKIFEKVSGRLVERIINETRANFEEMKRKYLLKLKREGLE